MELQLRKQAFEQLGNVLGHFTVSAEWPGFACGLSEPEFNEFNSVISQLSAYNGWFTEENVRAALLGFSKMLRSDDLNTWLSGYDFSNTTSRTVGVISAGNIPAVGFHDFMCALLAGHRIKMKLASDDNRLLPEIASVLIKLQPEFESRIEFVENKLEDFDAIIATGNNNTARHFEYYFNRYPNIIRRNRNSVAILTGDESEEELKLLGADVFTHYGLGCRNVTKVFFPKGFDKDRLFGAFYGFQELMNHNKYGNNYDYHRTLYLLNQEPVLENGFLLLKEDVSISSPVGTLYYEEYEQEGRLRDALNAMEDQIQCIVSRRDVPFGQAQKPRLWDYADGVDTMKFLQEL